MTITVKKLASMFEAVNAGRFEAYENMRKVIDWRWHRNHLTALASTMESGTIEYNNVLRRIRWIENNRL